jgi:hypothetical protein
MDQSRKFLQMIGGGGGTASGAKRGLNAPRRSAVARIIEQSSDGFAQLCGTDPAKVDAYADTGCDDLLRDYRLVVPDGGDHERQAVCERFAHRVVASVADHRVQVPKQVKLGYELADQHMIGRWVD